jgi:hypothetical protein
MGRILGPWNGGASTVRSGDCRQATRILIYSYAKGAKPVLRIEIGIDGKCTPAVRFDGSLLTIAGDLGYLRA